MFRKIANYFTEVGSELSKVSWPGREEVYGATMVVVVLCGVLSVFVFSVDYLLNHLLDLIF